MGLGPQLPCILIKCRLDIDARIDWHGCMCSLCRPHAPPGHGVRRESFFGNGHYLTTVPEYAAKYAVPAGVGEGERKPNAKGEYVVMAHYVNPMRCYAITRSKDYPKRGNVVGPTSEESRSYLHSSDGPGLIAKYGGTYRTIEARGFDTAYAIVSDEVSGQAVNLMRFTGGETARQGGHQREAQWDEIVLKESSQACVAALFYFKQPGTDCGDCGSNSSSAIDAG